MNEPEEMKDMERRGGKKQIEYQHLKSEIVERNPSIRADYKN
jgi:hypothetical protein